MWQQHVTNRPKVGVSIVSMWITVHLSSSIIIPNSIFSVEESPWPWTPRQTRAYGPVRRSWKASGGSGKSSFCEPPPQLSNTWLRHWRSYVTVNVYSGLEAFLGWNGRRSTTSVVYVDVFIRLGVLVHVVWVNRLLWWRLLLYFVTGFLLFLVGTSVLVGIPRRRRRRRHRLTRFTALYSTWNQQFTHSFLPRVRLASV